MKTAELEEAKEIISNLSAYGSIHTVRGVAYPAGTHGQFIKRAQRWLDYYYKNV